MEGVVVTALVKAIVTGIVKGIIVSAFLVGITCVLKAIAEELRRQEENDDQ